MTKEEEMAEEWIKEHSGLIGSYKFVKYDYDSLKQAFLTGLKVGKENLKKEIEENLLKCYSGYPQEIEE